jgi:thiamine kinase-like enzyme
MNLPALIKKVFNQSIIQSQSLESGLSNNNTLITLENDERFVVRTPHSQTEHFFDRQLESRIIERIQPLNLDVECLYFDPHLGIKITRYIEHAQQFSECTRSLHDKMNAVATLLRRLHDATIEGFPCFDPFERLHQYRQTIKNTNLSLYNAELEISLHKKWKQSPKILCHNDVVSGNLLFTPQRVYLIDYEYAGSNDPYFDLASFLSENNLVDPSSTQKLLVAYLARSPLPNEIHALMDWIHFQDLMWANWAIMMYEQHQRSIYHDIYLEKYTRYIYWQSRKN